MDTELLINAIETRKQGFQIANQVRLKALRGRTHEKWLHGLNGLFTVREPGTSLFDDAAYVQKALTTEGLSFCFIGGVALQYWGEARFTADLDLDVYCELGNESEILAALLRHLTFRDEESRKYWDSHRVFFGRSPNGYEVDIFVGFTPFEGRIAARAVSQDYGLDVALRICTAEYLVITKTVAGRSQDWADIERIVQRSGECVHWPLVFDELDMLLALYHEEDRLPRLKKMVLHEYPEGLPGVSIDETMTIAGNVGHISSPFGPLIGLLLLFMAACGAPPESREDYSLAVPLLMQTAEERTFKDVEFERIAPLLPPDSLHWPGGVHLLEEGVFVVEYSDMHVWRYDFDGSLLTTYGNGKGDGPGEMRNPLRISIVGDTLLILDAYALGVHRFLLDGTYVATDAIPRQGLAMASTQATSLILTATPNVIFRRYPLVEGDSTKAVFKEQSMMDAVISLGFLASDEKRFAYANRMLPFFAVLSARGDIEYARATIDDASFRFPDVPAPEDGVMRPPPALNREISIVHDRLYLHNVPLRTDSSRVVDVYDLESEGAYLHSFRIPFAATSMSFREDMMAARTGPTSAALFRVRERR